MSCGQIALNRLGIKVDNYFASEIKKHAIQCTMDNFPDTIQIGDVTKVKGQDLPKIHLLIGGSPCQDFSRANSVRDGWTVGIVEHIFSFLKGEEKKLFKTEPKCLIEERP
jgi:DNA (cytosine-5)-methyltransferase 3A